MRKIRKKEFKVMKDGEENPLMTEVWDSVMKRHFAFVFRPSFLAEWLIDSEGVKGRFEKKLKEWEEACKKKGIEV